MFLQVIEGKTKDRDGMRAAMDRWRRDLAPGATGWLGTTAGVADDGTFVATARFASEEDARRNSERPEQGAWWQEFARTVEGEPHFSDYRDVVEFGRGGSDQAGFVQVIRGHAEDVPRLQQLDRDTEGAMREQRPDVIGGIMAWDPSGDFTQVVYFTSEQEARAGEQRRTPELERFLAEFQALTREVRFVDLRQPMLVSP